MIGQRKPVISRVLIAWPRVLVALVAAAAAALLPWQAVTMRNPELLLMLCAIALVIVVGLGNGTPETGLVLMIISAMAIRFALPTGTQSNIPMSMVLSAMVILWWLGNALVSRRRLSLPERGIALPSIGFILAAILSYLWGNIFLDPVVRVWNTWPFVQLGALAILVLLPLTFLMAAAQTESVAWIKWIVGILLGGGALAILALLLNIQVLAFLQVRPLFPTWFICLALALALFHRGLPKAARGSLLAFAGLWFYWVFVLRFRWVSAWLPSVAGGLIILGYRSKRMLLVATAIFGVYVLLSLSTLKAGLSQEWDTSTVTRMDAWVRNWQVTKNHLLFGVGPAGYAAYYMTYFPDHAMATHNNYLDILSQMGIVGLGFLLWFLGSLGWLMLRLVRACRGSKDFTEAFSLAALAGFAGVILAMGLGDWIIPFVYTQTIGGFDYAVYTWILLGAAVALYQIKVQKMIRSKELLQSHRALTHEAEGGEG